METATVCRDFEADPGQGGVWWNSRVGGQVAGEKNRRLERGINKLKKGGQNNKGSGVGCAEESRSRRHRQVTGRKTKRKRREGKRKGTKDECVTEREWKRKEMNTGSRKINGEEDRRW